MHLVLECGRILLSRGNDKIIFGEGISINNLSFRQDGSNLDILINNGVSQGVTVKDFYSGTMIKKLNFIIDRFFCDLPTENLEIEINNNRTVYAP